jgi:hypothetical protein
MPPGGARRQWPKMTREGRKIRRGCLVLRGAITSACIINDEIAEGDIEGRDVAKAEIDIEGRDGAEQAFGPEGPKILLLELKTKLTQMDELRVAFAKLVK